MFVSLSIYYYVAYDKMQKVKFEKIIVIPSCLLTINILQITVSIS